MRALDVAGAAIVAVGVPNTAVEDVLDSQRLSGAIALDVSVRVRADWAQLLDVGI